MSWEQLAPQTVQRLSNDLSISPQVAAGIVGQLGYESAGLQSVNEMQPVVPGSRGGFGWAQWTGPRRRQFESWAEQNKMDVADPEANYQFLVYELTQTPEKKVLAELQGVEDPVEAGKVFTDTYLRPSVPAYDKRASWVEKTINTLVPEAQAQTQQGGNVAQQASPYSLEQLQTGLQRAQAAGNQEAVQEIQQLISAQQPTPQQPDTSTVQQQGAGYSMEQLQSGLQKAQAVGNQKAVQEIQGLISQASSPTGAQAPQQTTTPQNTNFFRVPTTEEAQRTGELTLRNIGEGMEQAFTFPVRALGEGFASVAYATGFPKASKAISETVGMRTPTVAGGIADLAGLATPETPFEKTVGGGVKALAGAGLGGVASNLARNAPQMTQQAVSNILPTAATGKQLGLFGGVGSAMEAAPMETAAGMAGVTTLAALAAGAAGRKSRLNVNTKKAENAILESAGGSPSRASMDSEIIKKINTEVNAPVRMVNGKSQPLTAMELNQKVQDSFITDTLEAVQKLPDDYPNKSLYLTRLAESSGLDSTSINKLRTDPVGIAVADAIEQAQRARVLTEAVPAAGGVTGAVLRAGVDATPIGISAATSVPAYIPQGLTASLKNKLGGRVNRDAKGRRFVGEPMVKAADNILAKTGPSERALGIKTIEEIAEQASKLQAAKKAVSAEEIAKKTAERAAKREADLAAKNQAELQQGIADIQAKDPSYLLGLSSKTGTPPRNQAEMSEFSSQIKRQMEAREALNAAPVIDPSQAALKQGLADIQSKDSTYLLGLSNPFGTPRSAKEMAQFSKRLKRDMEKRYDKIVPKNSTPAEVEIVKKNSLNNWTEGKTGSGGIQGTMTEYTGLKDKDLVDVLEELATRKPDFAPFIQNIRESSKVPNTQVLGMIQDEAVRIAAEKGLQMTPKVIKKAAKDAGVKGTSGIADEFFKRASNVVSSLDDEALQLVVNRTTSASGKEIDKPRSYATGIIAKILNDRAQGRALDEAAQTLLDTLGL